MKLFRKFIVLPLIALNFGLPALAQSSSMTDQQVMQYMLKENERGTSRSRIVTSLIERGVSIDQIRRIRAKYEKQQKGEVPGARDISGTGTGKESRMRNPNGEERAELKGNYQLKQREEDVREDLLSEKQRSIYRNRKEGEYVDELDEFLPDSLMTEEDFDYEDEYETYLEEGKIKRRLKKKVFGRNIFNRRQLSFEPNMNIATPQDYRLGPGDAVYIDVWGASQERFEATVSPDGEVNIEGFGPVNVDGLTVEQANSRLRSTLGARYGGSQVKLTVGQTRTIRVDVMGEVRTPGSYTLSAFSTVFHALYMAGGPNDIGTLRNIRIYRKGKLISTCDVYAYMLEGKMNGNVRLASGDVIIVDPYECLVEVEGKVKRPMYYEMREKESVATVLKYAGGFAGDAYREAVRLERTAGPERSVYTVDRFDQSTFQLRDGDRITVDSTLNRYANMVEIKGAVYRQGKYQMDGSINTVRQLLEAAGGPTHDAFLSRGVLHRRKADHTLEVLAIDIQGIMEHRVADVTLKNEDVFFVPSRELLQEERILKIDGEINYPGTYEFADNTTLEDLILQAGGLKDAASMVKIDVSRRMRDQGQKEGISQVAKSYTFSLKDGFVVDGEPGFVLEPFDEVFVRKSPGYVEQQHVSVTGEVAFTGTYVLTNKGMRLTDLVKAAGGLNKEAYALGAHLERELTPAEQIKQQTMVKLAVGGDSIDMRKLDLGTTQMVGINLEQAMKHPGDNKWDIVLREGDKLVVPQYTNTVSINGQVMYPNTVAYSRGERLSYYIEQAGGYGPRAKSKRVFAVNLNGTITRVRSSKDITPGCTLLVPAKSRRKGMSFGEIVSLGTMTATLGTVIATLIK